MVLYSTLDSESADAAIEVEVARFNEFGQGFEWKLHDHDAPSDLGARLAARGFVREPEEALVALDLEAPPAAGSADVAVREIHDTDEFELVYEIQSEAFGKRRRWQIDALIAEKAAVPDELHVYVAWIDGEPAASGVLRTRPDTPFASLWSGATVPAFRRRGAYRALVDVRLAEARARGYRYALVDAGPESLPILERLGFEVVTRMQPMIWRPPSGPGAEAGPG